MFKILQVTTATRRAWNVPVARRRRNMITGAGERRLWVTPLPPPPPPPLLLSLPPPLALPPPHRRSRWRRSSPASATTATGLSTRCVPSIRAAHWNASAPPRPATTSRTMCGLCVDYVWTMCGLCVDYDPRCALERERAAAVGHHFPDYVRTMCGLCVDYDPRCALEREAAVGHHFPDYVRTMCGLCVDYVWTMIRAAHWSASAPPRSATTSRTMCGLCADYVWTMCGLWSALRTGARARRRGRPPLPELCAAGQTWSETARSDRFSDRKLYKKINIHVHVSSIVFLPPARIIIDKHTSLWLSAVHKQPPLVTTQTTHALTYAIR